MTWTLLQNIMERYIPYGYCITNCGLIQSIHVLQNGMTDITGSVTWHKLKRNIRYYGCYKMTILGNNSGHSQLRMRVCVPILRVQLNTEGELLRKVGTLNPARSTHPLTQHPYPGVGFPLLCNIHKGNPSPVPGCIEASR